jgi:gliding motility-associated-like protein
LWYTSQVSNYSTSNIFNPVIYEPTTFYVAVTDAGGCTTTLSVVVGTLPVPFLEIGYDISTQWGTQVVLNPSTNGVSFWWTPATGLDCDTCLNPTVTATETATYYLTVQGANGCFSYDTITIFFDGVIYVPNSFSPDGNGVNDIFYAYGKDIIEFEMFIFDRWGEKIFYTDDMSIGWDGVYKGDLSKNDVYVWKIKYMDIQGTEGTMYGTATLLK